VSVRLRKAQYMMCVSSGERDIDDRHEIFSDPLSTWTIRDVHDVHDVN
jgi:hypothetical protein